MEEAAFEEMTEMRYMTSSFLSNVLYRVIAGFILFEKNALGCHEEPRCCPDSVVRGVCHETRGGIELGVSEERGVSKNFLRLAESRKGLLSPFDVGGLVRSWLRGCMMAAHEGKKRR